ncbi:ChaN family lipoprotein [uncultured Tenacibaculum sp.]|uniref:ChaN family lipoprotein n=1 Tax=uncultured Tenacibaculum sp. TaxID=174713 RepID=UPI00262A6C67|nr:ChaN family lipoprotein [uncultured Tenacibaculum sp.]
MKKTTFLLLFLFVALNLVAQKRAYKIYNAKGKKVSYNRMLKKLAKNDIVLFGELHNNPIAHWLQYEVTNDLHKTRKLILGAEMFEADNQQPLSQYVNGSINSKQLDTLARLWSNYKTDYAPLVNFAKDQKLNFVASNIPRRYANLVYKKGFEALDALSDTEKSWIAPLPIKFDSELPTYKKILTMMGDHGTPKLVMAQAIKDATMAHFILKNHLPNHLFLHYNGAYHSDYYEGILWYLKNENPNLNYATITTVLQKDINKLEKENLKKADFIICVDDNMTTTY